MFFCNNCGTILVEDSNLTMLKYNESIKLIIDDDGNLIKDNIPTFIVFSCRKCGETINIDIFEIIDKMRKYAIEGMLKHRINVAYKTVDRDSVDEANGVSYCGICPGVIDGSGYCYNDVISCCKNREVLLKDD